MLTDEVSDGRSLAVDVEFDTMGPHEVVTLETIDSDRKAVGANRRVVSDSGLGDVERRDDSMFVRDNLWRQSVDSRGFEPLC